MSPRVEGTATRRRRGASRDAMGAVPTPAEDEGEVAGPPRNGQKRTVMYYIRQLPNFLRLLVGLMTDPRVSAVDKLLVGGAIAYIIMPFDLVPDFIPFLGEVDDVYLLVLALQRLIGNAGRSTLLAHWSGAAEDLADMNLRAVFSAAAFFLPAKVRRRLRGGLSRV